MQGDGVHVISDAAVAVLYVPSLALLPYPGLDVSKFMYTGVEHKPSVQKSYIKLRCTNGQTRLIQKIDRFPDDQNIRKGHTPQPWAGASPH